MAALGVPAAGLVAGLDAARHQQQRARCGRAAAHASPSAASGRPHQQQQRQQQRQQRLRRVQASSTDMDLYVAAVHRLDSLISGVGDGEDELYYNMLLDEEPAQKLQINATLGAVCLTASTAICWLCGSDPAGGASLSLHSAQAALLGGGASLPLVGYKYISWQPGSMAGDATLGNLRRTQTDSAKPWLAGMSARQLLLHLLLDTLPPLFLMLPAAQAGLTSTFAFTRTALSASTGVQLPPGLGLFLGLLLTGLVTASVRTSDYASDPKQQEAVADAVANADRYYRLMASSSSSSSLASRGGGAVGGSSWQQEQEAAKAALAFKAVAVSWRTMEQEMMRLSATLQLLDFMYLGGLWVLTGDMAAPCVAALLAYGVDYHYMWSRLQPPGGGPRQQQGGAPGAAGGGGGAPPAPPPGGGGAKRGAHEKQRGSLRD